MPQPLLLDGGTRPFRALLRLLKPHGKQLDIAVMFFIVKDSPLWVLPILTDNIIEIVVAA